MSNEANEAAAKEAEKNAQTDTDQSSGLSNADWKSNPNTINLTAQVKALREEKEARAAADLQAESEAEKVAFEKAIKDAEEAKDWEKAQALQKVKTEEKDAATAREIQDLKLKLELSKLGFVQRGVDLLSSEYDPENGTIAEYAKTCAEDDGNKLFLTGAEKSTYRANETTKTVSDGGTGMTNEQARAFELSDDPEKKKLARDYNEAYYREHGAFPYKL